MRAYTISPLYEEIVLTGTAETVILGRTEKEIFTFVLNPLGKCIVLPDNGYQKEMSRANSQKCGDAKLWAYCLDRKPDTRV